MKSRCFIDADVLIHAFDDKDQKKSRKARQLLTEVSQEKVTAFTDVIVLIKTFHVTERIRGRETAKAVTKEILSLPGLQVFGVDMNTFFEATKRSEKYRLAINDLIHYVTALYHEAEAIYSYDKDFDGLEIRSMEP